MQTQSRKAARRRVLGWGRSTLLRAQHFFGMADALPLYYAADEAVRGRALLSYRPSLQLQDKNHTGVIECQVMAEVLCQMGFDVDAYSSSDNVNDVQGSRYDLILGFGLPFRQAIQQRKQSATVILYCTEGPPTLAEKLEREAIARLTANTGIPPSVVRHSELYQVKDIAVADALLVLGDDTERWATSGKPVYSLYPTGFHPVVGPASIASKEPSRELIWIGSSGVANKGLDLAFELASACASTLHVLGVQGKRERMILNELTRRNADVTAVDHGFLKYGSQPFTALLKQATACLLPSASEAAPTGCLTACRNGIPSFVLQNCGIQHPVGGMQPCVDQLEMGRALNGLLTMSSSDYRALALNTYQEANALFSIQNFRKTFEQRVRSILQA